ncbi:BTB/POZ domain-containing protein At5g17580 isoform X1 [Benincasa hispida]|uniref:BTB/POZ domain-containing protein At5g17580 isoform X1 n=1 Tax=Benincasa hispida TaxID=102211 RepID=UPI0019005DFD|nr:BTB/POZ domain-containing protein At5g17580 isoform X1 [Benincasa hispida]XP_038901002.1 BTB/POZ domain-containing protein At5g17580 isoform X1 [Benincasa hispida]
MVDKPDKDASYWLPKPKSRTDIQFHVSGVPFTLDRNIIVEKSGKIAELLNEQSEDSIHEFLRSIPAHPNTFELVARFCHGFSLQMSCENVLPLACLAFYLGMTESHSPNNLLSKALTFFEQKILPSWNGTIKAFLTTEDIMQQAVDTGLVDECIESLVSKAVNDPYLLGEPIVNFINEEFSEDDVFYHKPSTRRKLFVSEWQSEDLIILPISLYELTIHSMNQHAVPPRFVAASLLKYAKKWVFCSAKGDEKMSVCKTNRQREVIEAVERLLPHQKGLFPCTILFEMLQYAIRLEANAGCRNGLELRIGKQLDQATASDLLIPSRGYAKEMRYDIECVKRIAKHFYTDYSSNIEGLIAVAKLIEEFLFEVASDRDLEISAFVSLVEMSSAASMGTDRSSDGIYRAIDIYLDKHSFLTESEREEVCRGLDYHRMSAEACEHAAKNQRLPLRIVVQVLFLVQLQLRDAITRDMQRLDNKLTQDEVENDKGELALSDGIVKNEMEKMSNKVIELEKDCHMMRKEIEEGCIHMVRKEKTSMWREMKRKFGCINKMNNCNCQVKKKRVHPKLWA